MHDTEIYKKRLQEELSLLKEELSKIGIHNPDNPSDWVAVPEDGDHKEADPNDAADTIEEWNERRALVATLEPRYNNIASALKRIEEGTYGKCLVCNEDIGDDRLNANPAAKTCTTHIEENV